MQFFLNVNRASLWASNVVGVGVNMAQGREPSRAWADSLADCPEGAEDAYFDMLARHQERRGA